MGENGRVATFPGGRGVPLVGQPCELKGWSYTQVLVCNCEAKPTLLLVSVGRFGGAVECPACHRIFQLRALSTDPVSGELNAGIGIGQRIADGTTEGVQS